VKSVFSATTLISSVFVIPVSSIFKFYICIIYLFPRFVKEFAKKRHFDRFYGICGLLFIENDHRFWLFYVAKAYKRRIHVVFGGANSAFFGSENAV